MYGAPTFCGAPRQNPHIEKIGQPDVFLLPIKGVQEHASEVAKLLSLIRKEFDARQSAHPRGDWPDRLPKQWRPQAFVDRMTAITSKPSLCGE